MSKRFTKIICAVTASTFILGAAAAAGCSNYYSSKPLDGGYAYTGKAESNGGFAVEAGKYIYYINGVEAGTALNDFGKPVKGAIYRISTDNLKNKKYSNVQRVVPNIAYSSNYNAGIFIYGERIYYGTPSTAKNSEGVVQNSYLDMKSSKLDGTETLKNAYVSFPSASYEYRYVEEEGTVYLLYVATEEKLYEESTGVKNLHSYNTVTGVDTLLAYNVSDVTFDSEDKTNPRVYYTMNVYNYNGTSNSTYGYNQLYTVKANATEDKFAGKLNSGTVLGWNDNADEGTVDRYINCGELVLDGISELDAKTPFNFEPDKTTANKLSYTYTVKQYVNGKVYYTRTTSLNKNAYLFYVDDGDIKPIENNKDVDSAILLNGDNADSYKFVTGKNNEPAVLCAESSGITINYFVKDYKLGGESSDLPSVDIGGGEYTGNTYYPIANKGSATILHVDETNKYVYYSDSDSKISRVKYDGLAREYKEADLLINKGGQEDDTLSDYAAATILDLKSASSWYSPEFIEGYILFASNTANMTNYNYVMVFDVNGMKNADIRTLNKQYEGIEKNIKDVFGNTDNYPAKTYANLENALRYAFYNGSFDYLEGYAKELNDALEEDADLVYSEQTFAEYDKFVKAEGDVWGEYGGENYKTVNGNKVYANNHDYYYALLGEMSEEDVEAYAETLRVSYLASKPAEEEETGWYEGLSTVEKAFFIIGMCLIGIIVIGGGAWLTVYLVRRNKKEPEERRRRIKVDTTDDKSVDVYDYQE